MAEVSESIQVCPQEHEWVVYPPSEQVGDVTVAVYSWVCPDVSLGTDSSFLNPHSVQVNEIIPSAFFVASLVILPVPKVCFSLLSFTSQDSPHTVQCPLLSYSIFAEVPTQCCP